MLNKGYDPDTLRAMTLAAQDPRANGFAFNVDGTWWLVTGRITGATSRGFMRLDEVWINGKWRAAKNVLGLPLISALAELLQEACFPTTEEVSNAQA